MSECEYCNLEEMEFGKNLNDAKYMFLGIERGAEEMLDLYIYNYMKKQGLHGTAKIFAEEANVEMSELDYDDSLLKDWWDGFCTQFRSRMTKQQSPAQSPLQEALQMLELLKSSQPPQHVSNVMGQPAKGVLQAPQEMSQRRAGKRPMNTDSASILGHSGSKEKGKGPIGFPPVRLLPSEITLVPHSGNSSHLQLPGTIQPPQVVGAYQSVQLEPTYPAGQDLAHSPATPIFGENNQRNQRSLMGNAPDGPVSNSSRIQVPATFFELMKQEAGERERH